MGARSGIVLTVPDNEPERRICRGGCGGGEASRQNERQFADDQGFRVSGWALRRLVQGVREEHTEACCWLPASRVLAG